MTFAESLSNHQDKGLLTRVLSHIGSWPAPTSYTENKKRFEWFPKIGMEVFATLELHEKSNQITFTSFCTECDYIKVILSSYNFHRLEKIKDFLQSTLP